MGRFRTVAALLGLGLSLALLDVRCTAQEDKGKGLKFHPRCAYNMAVSDDGRRAFRKINNDFGHSAAMTNRPLKKGELFEIYLESSEYVEHPRIGVTTHFPEDIEYPDYMNHLKTGTWGWDVWPNDIYRDGEPVKEPYPEEERTYLRGDTFGVLVTEDGELHFFHNSEDLGEADVGLTDEYYGYIDLYWGGSNATIVTYDDFLTK